MQPKRHFELLISSKQPVRSPQAGSHFLPLFFHLLNDAANYRGDAYYII